MDQPLIYDYYLLNNKQIQETGFKAGVAMQYTYAFIFHYFDNETHKVNAIIELQCQRPFAT